MESNPGTIFGDDTCMSQDSEEQVTTVFQILEENSIESLEYEGGGVIKSTEEHQPPVNELNIAQKVNESPIKHVDQPKNNTLPTLPLPSNDKQSIALMSSENCKIKEIDTKQTDTLCPEQILNIENKCLSSEVIDKPKDITMGTSIVALKGTDSSKAPFMKDMDSTKTPEDSKVSPLKGLDCPNTFHLTSPVSCPIMGTDGSMASPSKNPKEAPSKFTDNSKSLPLKDIDSPRVTGIDSKSFSAKGREIDCPKTLSVKSKDSPKKSTLTCIDIFSVSPKKGADNLNVNRKHGSNTSSIKNIGSPIISSPLKGKNSPDVSHLKGKNSPDVSHLKAKNSSDISPLKAKNGSDTSLKVKSSPDVSPSQDKDTPNPSLKRKNSSDASSLKIKIIPDVSSLKGKDTPDPPPVKGKNSLDSSPLKGNDSPDASLKSNNSPDAPPKIKNNSEMSPLKVINSPDASLKGKNGPDTSPLKGKNSPDVSPLKALKIPNAFCLTGTCVEGIDQSNSSDLGNADKLNATSLQGKDVSPLKDAFILESTEQLNASDLMDIDRPKAKGKGSSDTIFLEGKDSPNNLSTPILQGSGKVQKDSISLEINLDEQQIVPTTPFKNTDTLPQTETVEASITPAVSKQDESQSLNKEPNITFTLSTITNDTGSPMEVDITSEDSNNKNMKDGKQETSPIDAYLDSESTNDSISEKETSKGISRELRSLIASAKESKIISECTQIKTKIRKSRILDGSNTSLNSTLNASADVNISQTSIPNSSLDKTDSVIKRSMRSQNPDFVSKQKHFLNSLTGKLNKDGPENSTYVEPVIEPPEQSKVSPTKTSKKKKDDIPPRTPDLPSKVRSDLYCWRCHYLVEPTSNAERSPPKCTVCPRSYHFKCLTSNEKMKVTEKTWVCPDCMTILQCENIETRAPALRKVSQSTLNELLQYAWRQISNINGVEPFMSPVDRGVFQDYDKYVVHSMDLTMIKERISAGFYNSTEAFLSDTQWILHNCVVFNTQHAKLTAAARALVRACRAEMAEIETCPQCYEGANAGRETWFTDVCSTPHMLLWAKLKGFPYWPAKGMSVNHSGLVDVRFFGAHDRAWVPARDCFLYSVKDPNNFRTKRQDILDSMKEAEIHIENIARKFGSFVHAPFKTQFEPNKLAEQLKTMIPGFKGEIAGHKPLDEKGMAASPASVKASKRKRSKCSKDSFLDMEATDEEEAPPSSKRKMADGGDIKPDDTNDRSERAKSVETRDKTETSRRRRSMLEEARIITIMDGAPEKRSRVETPEATPPIENIKTRSSKRNISLDNDKFNSKDTPEKEGIPKIFISKDTGKIIIPKEKVTPSSPKPEATSTPKISKDKPKLVTLAPKPVTHTPKPVTPTPKPVTLTPKLITPAPKPDIKEKSLKTSKQNVEKEPANSKSTSKHKHSSKRKKREKRNEKVKSAGLKQQKQPENKAENGKNEKKIQNRILFDDDTSLDVVARQLNSTPAIPGLPTINDVRSLSTPSLSVDSPTSSTSTRLSETVTLQPPTTSTKESADKQEKSSNTSSPLLGRVGVRSFARMTSPPATNETTQIEVEIKAEPIDYEDSEQSTEKLDMLKVYRLQPVNSANKTPRDMAVNKVTSGSVRRPVKPVEIRPKAKKSFPQPKKDGRSELNGKNSMVYIPIQPPATQSPVRPPVSQTATRPSVSQVTIRPSVPPTSIRPPVIRPVHRSSGPIISKTISLLKASNSVNSVTATQLSSVTMTTSASSTASMSTATMLCSTSTTPTIAPTTVHTVPLITTVNGQWTIALQPMMSVGNTDNPSLSEPLVNGVTDRPGIPTATPAPPILNKDTDTSLPAEPPLLLQRPLLHPLDATTPLGDIPTPSSAGDVTAKLNQNAVKMTDFFRTLLEESIQKLHSPITDTIGLKKQIEHLTWKHKHEIEELKHNHELMMSELRSTVEAERARIVNEIQQKCLAELEAAVSAAKGKQWCANCRQEAQFYCCWNTSYCDYPCQRAHWSQHYNLCTQQRNQGALNDRRMNPLQPPEVQKSASTVGGKQVSTKGVNHVNSASKQSIIVVDDTNDSTPVKFIGSYKPNTMTSSQMLLKSQFRPSEETPTKVVTSGGYLIVGASQSNTPSVTVNNRPS